MCENPGQKPEGIAKTLKKIYPEEYQTKFCKKGGCMCQINDPTLWADVDNLWSSQTSGSVKITDCEHWEDLFFSGDDEDFASYTMEFMGMIEQKFSCSGVCKVDKFYYFSDLNE